GADTAERGRKPVEICLATHLAVRHDIDAGALLIANGNQRRIVLRLFEQRGGHPPELSHPDARRRIRGEQRSVDEPLRLRIRPDDRCRKQRSRHRYLAESVVNARCATHASTRSAISRNSSRVTNSGAMIPSGRGPRVSRIRDRLSIDTWGRGSSATYFAVRCFTASLQGASRLRCKVLHGFVARCFTASLQGASRLRCKVLHGFVARCFTTSLQGASRLRSKVLHGFAARCFAPSPQGASRPRSKVLHGFVARCFTASLQRALRLRCNVL